MSCIWFMISILFCLMFDAIVGEIQWRDYDPKFLESPTREFYTNSWDALIPVPQIHSDDSTGKVFHLYVRKFSRELRARKHLWLISGGPGSSTSGIERALNTQLPDTAIYLMDNRGLGHSHKICHHSESQKCQKKPVFCYKRLNYDPKTLSIHETAKDYNMISRMILEEEGGDVYMYGSSYGATLAYTAFRFDPKLYSGLLLEAFVPEFRLNEDIDVREHVINSCFSSKSCFASIGGKLSRKEAVGMMETLLKDETQNGCKAGLEFLGQNSLRKNLSSLLNTYIRVAFYKKTGLRSAFLPILYGATYCPNLEVFNGMLREFHSMYVTLAEEYGSESNLPQILMQTHCSTTPNTNHFFGDHIRYSEYSYEANEKFKKCREVGHLNAANWSDVCGIVSDFNEDYSPYLYEPVVADPTFGELSSSPTRIVIVTGKMDTQTPHDSSEREYERLPVRNKHIFSADHGGHGIIDTWEVPGLGLDLMLDFTMTGSKKSEATMREALRLHNSDAERIWNYYDKDVFGDRDIWNLEAGEMEYNWDMFLAIVGCCLIPISLTYLIKRRQLSRLIVL